MGLTPKSVCLGVYIAFANLQQGCEGLSTIYGIISLGPIHSDKTRQQRISLIAVNVLKGQHCPVLMKGNI